MGIRIAGYWVRDMCYGSLVCFSWVASLGPNCSVAFLIYDPTMNCYSYQRKKHSLGK
ncbi:hypothetical protein KL86DES1_22293 [uncultured Desulfovibrio sp.]|uniref:Uncharacterized protein n=1 Tax=uncultured Desulfovibrio sp. TaxID=167968 RepID=A0A212LBS6_9BACT|nr:hypothetical protein KL86DES1_22293 [uncultured Desulfovibrio sp.]VZH35186.1 conserved protein of unknown function [Desulfovibrio sp. 86]